jgi:molybdate transport system ATP-binding protein
MTILVDVSHRLGGFQLEARFASPGHLTALFGPSGSGKTSIISMIAGLIRPDSGSVEVDGRVLTDRASGVFVPTHRRRIGAVFQDARLFPHMSVRGNLAYGKWFAPARERYADTGRIVELLGIGHLLERSPNLLSGGEKQRVAIGRALLASPRLLLMDEPLASLDEARKSEIMPYIERLRDELKIPIVYVSHSIAEVARLATDIVVMSDGKVVASGRTGEIVQRLDLLPAEERGEGGVVLDMTIAAHHIDYGMTVLKSVAGEIRVPRIRAETGAMVRLRLRARDVMIATAQPIGLSAQNILRGKIARIARSGDPLVEIHVDCHGQQVLSRITRLSLDALRLHVGQEVFAVIKSVAFDHENLSNSLADQGF